MTGIETRFFGSILGSMFGGCDTGSGGGREYLFALGSVFGVSVGIGVGSFVASVSTCNNLCCLKLSFRLTLRLTGLLGFSQGDDGCGRAACGGPFIAYFRGILLLYKICWVLGVGGLTNWGCGLGCGVCCCC